MSDRRIRREKFLMIVAEPDAIENICDRVSDGETLSNIAREMGAKYRWLYNWLYDTDFPERAEQLAMAMNARDSFTKEETIGQLQNLSGLDIRDAYDESGQLLPIKKIPTNVAKAITAIDVVVSEDGDVTKKVRFVDRGQMIALSGRRNKMFIDKVEVAGQVSLEQAVQESIKAHER